MLQDLDYADSLALLYAAGKQLQLKTNELVRGVPRVGMHANNKKSKVMSVAPTFQQVITINPLSPGIKLQILFLCFHTFLTKVVGRSC